MTKKPLGKHPSVEAAAKARGLSVSTLRARIRRGLPVDDALKKRVTRLQHGKGIGSSRVLTEDQRQELAAMGYASIAAAARAHGLSPATLHRRLASGMRVVDALGL